MRALDWFGRLVIAVMSALATLSLIASFASVSNVPLPMPGSERVASVAARDDPAPPGSAAGSREQAAREVALRGSVTSAAGPESTRELARWLEALTYAVMALAGFAAVGVVLLLRIGSHLARIAER